MDLHVSSNELLHWTLVRSASIACDMSLKMHTTSGRVLLNPSLNVSLRARSTARPIECRPRRGPPVRAIVQEQTPQQAGTNEAENQLQALKAISLVVADTGEIDSIRKYCTRVCPAAKHRCVPDCD